MDLLTLEDIEEMEQHQITSNETLGSIGEQIDKKLGKVNQISVA